MRITREKKFRNGTGSEQLTYWFMRTCQSKIYLALVVIKRWRHLSETLFIQWHCWTGRTLSNGQTAIINTGTETARESKKVPVFVPVSYSNGEKKIIGSTVLFPSTISEMTQYVVKNDCRYLETKTEAVNGIDMLFCSVSFK